MPVADYTPTCCAGDSRGVHAPYVDGQSPVGELPPDDNYVGPTPLAVLGPTGSGKSDLGVHLAHIFGGEVINVDSMQLYRGMDIGTAKLTVEERAGVPHHLLDVWEVTDEASVARFQADATAAIHEIGARGKRPILVGGSMLYIQSLIDGWQFPPTDPERRAYYYALVEEKGIAAVHALLGERDPQAAAIIENNDVRRTVRALEVFDITGEPFAASQPVIGDTARFRTVLIGLQTEPEWLNPRIELRTRTMFARGLVAEVEHLVDHHGLTRESTAGRAIGYAQALDYLAGDIDAATMVDTTITGTRRYVRRQKSWFRRDPRISWIPADDNPNEAARKLLESRL